MATRKCALLDLAALDLVRPAGVQSPIRSFTDSPILRAAAPPLGRNGCWYTNSLSCHMRSAVVPENRPRPTARSGRAVRPVSAASRQRRITAPLENLTGRPCGPGRGHHLARPTRRRRASGRSPDLQRGRVLRRQNAGFFQGRNYTSLSRRCALGCRRNARSGRRSRPAAAPWPKNRGADLRGENQCADRGKAPAGIRHGAGLLYLALVLQPLPAAAPGPH